MADIKISQLTAKAAKVESDDRIPIADFNGTTYDTKYVTGSEINEVKLDISPQLGGNLDVNGFKIVSEGTNNVVIGPNGSGILKIESNVNLQGLSGSTAKEILFYEGFSNGTNYVALKAPNTLSADTTYTLPTADGTSGQVLSTNGTGTLSWTNNDSGLTVDSTAITSGTAGRVFFQNASNQLSQSANLFWDNTNNRLGINTASPATALHVVGTTRITHPTLTGTIDIELFTANGRGRINTTGTGSIGEIFRWGEGGNIVSTQQSFSGSRGITISNNQANGIFNAKLQNLLNQTSGSTDVTSLEITTAVTHSGTYSGIARGIYYAPSSVTYSGTHRAIETTTGSVIFNSTSGNVAIGGTSFGTSSDKVLAQYTGTAPGSSPADAYQQYSADITTGNAAPHFRTENGNVVKLYQQSSAGITTVSDLVTILQNLGLLS
jgi:hypothetical protein